jgi:hypothetical protein
MSAIFTLEQVSTSPRFEFVAMRFRDQTPLVPYPTAFKILNGVCMAAKHAMRYEAVANKYWRTLAYIDVDTVTFRAAREPRRSNLKSNVSNWRVNIENQLIVLYFETRNNKKALVVKMHYADALQWYTMARLSAREAKAWAGDDSKNMQATAHLTDAAANARFPNPI